MHTGRRSRWIFVPFVAIIFSLPSSFAQGQEGEKPKGEAKRESADKAPPIDPNAAVIVLDDFESDLRWAVQGWGNPAEIAIAPHGSSKALKVVYQPGPKDKNAIGMTYHADLSSRDRLVFHAFNPGEKMVQGTIAFFCTQGGNFFESSWFYVKKGENKDVTIDLKAPTFKSETSKWAYRATVPLAHVRAIVFMFYARADGELYIDNVRLVRNP